MHPLGNKHRLWYEKRGPSIKGWKPTEEEEESYKDMVSEILNKSTDCQSLQERAEEAKNMVQERILKEKQYHRSEAEKKLAEAMLEDKESGKPRPKTIWKLRRKGKRRVCSFNNEPMKHKRTTHQKSITTQ